MTRKAPRKQACFLPEAFEPCGTNELVRLGSDHDGGHVVSADAVASTRSLLSLGLGLNCDFEWDISAMGRIARMHCYDPGIDRKQLEREHRLWLLLLLSKSPRRRKFEAFYRQYRKLFDAGRPGFVHHRQAVGREEGMIGLDAAIAELSPEPGSLFLKVDIGGSEYDILDQVIEANEFLCGLVIKFHRVPERLREIEVFVTAMKEFMVIDNTVANNSEGMSGQGIPNTFEITLSAREQQQPHIPLAGATTRYQLLNAPNDPALPDFEIVYRDVS